MPRTLLRLQGLLFLSLLMALGCSPELEPPKPPERPADPEAVARILAAARESNPSARLVAVANLVETLGEQDLPDVKHALERSGDIFGAGEIDLFARYWAKHDRRGAANWAWKRAPEFSQSAALDAVMETLGHDDPEFALVILKEQEMSRSYGDIARSAVVRGWYFSGRSGFEDFMRGLGHDYRQMLTLSAVSRAIVLKEGVQGLADWLGGLEDEGHMFKTTAYRRAGPVMLAADQDFALAWCDRVCDGPHGAHLRAIIAKSWGSKGGGGDLMEWVSKAPPGDERDRAVQAAFMGWRSRDPRALIAWVDAMGPDGVEDWFMPAVDRVAMWKSWDYPLVAYEWASLIEDPDKRELTYISITRRFREADFDAAEAWIEQSPLSEEARAQARTYPEKWHGRGSRPYPPQPKSPEPAPQG